MVTLEDKVRALVQALFPRDERVIVAVEPTGDGTYTATAGALRSCWMESETGDTADAALSKMRATAEKLLVEYRDHINAVLAAQVQP